MDKKTDEKKVPSKAYAYHLLAKHSEIKAMKPQFMDKKRREAIYRELLEPWLEGWKNLLTVINPDLALVVNVDETPLFFEQPDGKVVVASDRFEKPALESPIRHQNCTVTLAIAMSGDSYRTQFLVPYQEIPKEYQTLANSGEVYVDHCKKGYQTTETFETYIKTILLPQLFERRKSAHPSQQTIILLVDGHTSRTNPSLLRYCDDNNVIIICLPSHTSHKLQPLDCGPNGLLKRKLSFYITEDIRLFGLKPHELSWENDSGTTKVSLSSCNKSTPQNHSILPRRSYPQTHSNSRVITSPSQSSPSQTVSSTVLHPKTSVLTPSTTPLSSPHMSRPLEVVSKPQIYKPFCRQMESCSTAIGLYRQRVVRCLLKALKDSLTSSVIIQGFKAAGLYSQFHLDLVLKKLDALPPTKTYLMPTCSSPESFKKEYWISSPEHLASLSVDDNHKSPQHNSEFPKRIASQESLDYEIERNLLKVRDDDSSSSGEEHDRTDEETVLLGIQTKSGRRTVPRSLYSSPPDSISRPHILSIITEDNKGIEKKP